MADDNLNQDESNLNFSRIDNEEEKDLSSGGQSLQQDDNGTTGREFLTEEERFMIDGESTEVKQLHNGQGPLDNPVIHRSYTDRKFAGDTTSPILEPNDARQVITPTPTPSGPTVTPPSSQQQNQKVAQENYKDRLYADNHLGEKELPYTGGNPAVQTMTTKERKENLEMTVTTAIEGYAKGKEWIGGWLTISDSNLIKREKAGKTPPDWAVLYDSSINQAMTLRQFVNEGNKRIEQACKTDEAFKAKVKPILMAEFDRRNWIISPKQNGFIMFGTDLLSMGQKLFTLHMNMRKVINSADKEFEMFNKTGYLSARQQYNLERNFMASPPPPINYAAPAQTTQNNTTADSNTAGNVVGNNQATEQIKNQPITSQVIDEKKPKTETITLPAEDDIEFQPPVEE